MTFKLPPPPQGKALVRKYAPGLWGTWIPGEAYDIGHDDWNNAVQTALDRLTPTWLIDPSTLGGYGWAVFDSAGSESGPWQIQSYDDGDEWESDCDAWAHVVTLAMHGHEVALRALAYVAVHNRMEYDAIIGITFGLEVASCS